MPTAFEDRVGVLLDERDALVVEHLERRQRAGEERHRLGVASTQPRRLAGGAAATARAAASGARFRVVARLAS